MEDFLKKLHNAGQALNTALVERAYTYAAKCHEGQRRKSGEPYLVHPVAVAGTLMDMDMDSHTIAAALLHDVVEDTPATIEAVERDFGGEIARLVRGLTKIEHVAFQSTEERQAENIRRMLVAMADDIRVIFIKLADRLHNMRTLEFQDPERQKDIARETLDVYAPLAHRLGIYSIKWELEDLSLKYIDPKSYSENVDMLARKSTALEGEIAEIIAHISRRLEEMAIPASIAGRPKHIYSIYRKMKEQDKTFEQIYDILAVRIIVNSVKDCYGALGMVHTMWKPIPGRFKDYIAVPKNNLYQSLHTTLVNEHGMAFEVQIRTWDMHRISEYGIAAHWQYKEHSQSSKAGDVEDKFKWLRSILEWQNETRDAREFMDNLKLDLFNDEIFVFTPKSDVISLPLGATPIDFAYYIHSAIGNRCVGAKINGRMYPLDTELKTGDIVEIVTSNTSKGPSRDWLKIVKSNQAKAKIRAWFKKEFKQENIEQGRTMVEEAAKKHGIALGELLIPDWLQKLYKRYSLSSLEDLYAAIGCGGIPASQVVGRLADEHKRAVRLNQRRELEALLERDAAQAHLAPHQSAALSPKPDRGVTVRGQRGMLVRFARCCNPLPGEDILGFVTRGRGVSIHRKDCPNIGDMLADSSRLISVAWEEDAKAQGRVSLRITALDKPGIFADITNAIVSCGLKVMEVNAKVGEGNGMAEMTFALQAAAHGQMENLLKALKRMAEIQEVQRL